MGNVHSSSGAGVGPAVPEMAIRFPLCEETSGDGVGPEVIRAAVQCLRALDVPLEIAEPVHGTAAVAAGESAFSDEARAACTE